jgi:hypothetical protein
MADEDEGRGPIPGPYLSRSRGSATMPIDQFRCDFTLTAEEQKTNAYLMGLRAKRIAMWRKANGLSSLAAHRSG